MAESARDAFPYDCLDERKVWPSDVRSPFALDPQGSTKFSIADTMKIGSIGSCFATRIAAELRRAAVPYLVTEPGPASIPSDLAAAYGYWPLSARYGNVYTSLQLLQLLERARGALILDEPAWIDHAGKYRDPFRPKISIVGFDSEDSLERDRERHLIAVRRLFTEVDVLIVTLGLTDVWCSAADGAAFPRCPGRGIGAFDRDRYVLRTLDVAENIQCLTAFVEGFREVNRLGKIIFSVSPVHLAATTSDVHVFRASTYAKSVLRAAVETVVRSYDFVDYFASYEIATLPYAPVASYASDGRHVSDELVDNVLRLFFKHFLGREFARVADDATAPKQAPCDEDELLALISQRDGENVWS